MHDAVCVNGESAIGPVYFLEQLFEKPIAPPPLKLGRAVRTVPSPRSTSAQLVSGDKGSLEKI